MNLETHTADRHPAPHKTLELHVRYLGAHKPFEDLKADQTKTLQQIKPRVLEFFKLSEGPANGGTKIYVFSHAGTVVPDLNVTLGALAQGKHSLKLDLLERFDQG